MKFLKLATLIFILAGLFALTACLEDNGETPTAQENLEDEAQFNLPENDDPAEEDAVEEYTPAEYPTNEVSDLDLPPLDGTILEEIRDNPVVMLQLSPLTPGEELAILHTNMGDITIRFFPEEAPMAVENFTTHARNGYYDGLIFHRVIPGFMIQGGCPNGQGNGGESIWGGTFGTETSFNLRHFRGALAMAHAGPGTIGSQFYIVQNYSLNPMEVMNFQQDLEYLDEPIGQFSDGRVMYFGEVHPAESLNHFINYGGTPHLDWFWNAQGPHPVFAHVVEGMDVVDAIANTPQGAGNRPIEDMIIESISFIIYGE